MNPDWFVGVDIGGSSIKAAVVDVSTGQRLASVCTPTTSARSPHETAAQVAEMVEGLGSIGPVGVALPGMVRDRVVERAVNLSPDWSGCDAASLMSEVLRRPVALLNDADAAGLAEIRHGAGHGCSGTVLMLTFGTGIGSALFVDGRLVPGTELGHLSVDGLPGEQLAAARAIQRDGLNWHQWAGRVNRFLASVETVIAPDLLIFGGAISREAHLWRPLLHTRTERVVAHFLGDAGVVGAAMKAREEHSAVSAPLG